MDHISLGCTRCNTLYHTHQYWNRHPSSYLRRCSAAYAAEGHRSVWPEAGQTPSRQLWSVSLCAAPSPTDRSLPNISTQPLPWWAPCTNCKVPKITWLSFSWQLLWFWVRSYLTWDRSGGACSAATALFQVEWQFLGLQGCFPLRSCAADTACDLPPRGAVKKEDTANNNSAVAQSSKMCSSG